MESGKNPMGDEELADLIKNSPENLEGLINRYWDRLFYFIKKVSYFGDEDAEDILQNVFIKVYKNINDFDSSMKFSSWIYRITRNEVVDQIRKKQARPQNISYDASEILKLTGSEINIEKDIQGKEARAEIMKIISGLPVKYREAIILKFLEEKSYDEMMDILKKPKGTVAALINRGKKLMQKEAEKRNITL
ncbi:MAG: sigma-70 family RNA polymerase sigma factor [Candidatus Moranbacteria bacterium]|nr:sigma-70 family RNA polymerase sigma factor [Candidatus Moranbacteria bacterium]